MNLHCSFLHLRTQQKQTGNQVLANVNNNKGWISSAMYAHKHTQDAAPN